MNLLRATLQAEPFAVRAGGDLYPYPALPALPWVLALTDGLWRTAVFPLLVCDPQREQAKDAIQYGDLSMDQVNRAAFDAIGQAGGRKWWETYNLCSVALADTSGALLGRLIAAGVDPGRVTLAGWCSAIYATMVQDADDKGRARLDAVISTPPPIAEAYDDAAGDSFDAMIAAARMG